MKQRHLEDAAEGLDRPDPIKPVNWVKIQEAVQKFVTQIELTKDPLTYKVYEQNLREYSEWTKLTYVDRRRSNGQGSSVCVPETRHHQGRGFARLRASHIPNNFRVLRR
jgi:hypothetical protein